MTPSFSSPENKSLFYELLERGIKLNMMNLSATSSEIGIISIFSDKTAIEERKSDPQDFATLQASLEMSTDQQIERIV
jgi:hypothetical protein